MRATRAIALYELTPSGPSPEELERRVYSCLRSAMLCMAAIDGEIHSTELMAISALYQSITKQKIDIGTLENQAKSAIGQHEKMLDTLDCLSPYLHPGGRSDFLKAVMAIAAADGRLDPSEIVLIEAVGEALNLDRSDLKSSLIALKRSRELS